MEEIELGQGPKVSDTELPIAPILPGVGPTNVGLDKADADSGARVVGGEAEGKVEVKSPRPELIEDRLAVVVGEAEAPVNTIFPLPELSKDGPAVFVGEEMDAAVALCETKKLPEDPELDKESAIVFPIGELVYELLVLEYDTAL